MLVEFSVANFRSIKDPVTLSMVGKKHTKKNHVLRNIHKTDFKSVPWLMETAMIYGANGSGKSNILKAAKFFKDFIINSSKGSTEGEAIETEPFLFSKVTQKEPSEFEIIFIHDNFRFQYGFAVDEKIVHSEWLYATPSGKGKEKSQTWFTREYQEIQVSNDYIKGNKAVWKEATRNNALFLSTAVNLNSEELKKPFQWLQNTFTLLLKPENLSNEFTCRMIPDDQGMEKYKVKLFPITTLNILRYLNINDNISIKEVKFEEKNISFPSFLSEEAKNDILRDMKGKDVYKAYFNYKTEEGGTYSLPIEEESDGTQKIFALAGLLSNILNAGRTILIDELNNSLHPLALEAVIKLFQNKEINTKNAQLIFTSHDTNPMNKANREQIITINKGEFGNTQLKRISDFKGREDEAVETRYRNGRYNGIPHIKEVF